MDSIVIREAVPGDLDSLLAVVSSAFARDDEAVLVRELLDDPTAEPRLSLVALRDNQIVGHILFTAARLVGRDTKPRATILAPLAVAPDCQGLGIGQRLIEKGLAMLASAGVELVFVLGHPTYYPRCGFEPAGRLGLDAPYPIPEPQADAWMVQALRPGLLGTVRGTVACAQALDKEEDWSE